MDITYTPEQQALQQRLAEYMKTIVTDDLIQEKKNPELFEIEREKMINGLNGFRKY